MGWNGHCLSCDHEPKYHGGYYGGKCEFAGCDCKNFLAPGRGHGKDYDGIRPLHHNEGECRACGATHMDDGPQSDDRKEGA